MVIARNNLRQILLLLGAAAGGLAGWRAGASVPPAPLPTDPQLERGSEWAATRDEAHPLEVTPAKWQPLPRLYADFDIECKLELAPDTDFDLLLRLVEPRDLQGQQLTFDGRFAALRVSSRRAAEPLRTREGALFGPPGGALVEAGLPTTVQVEGRGRQVRAQVSFKGWSPWFTTADEHGSFALAAHGGKALVRTLKITNLGEPARLPIVPLAVVLGALLAAVGWGFGICRKTLAVSLLLWPVGTELARRLSLYDLLPLARPLDASLLWLLGAGLPLLLAAWVPRRRWWLAAPLALLAFTAAMLGTADRELPRRAHGVPPLLPVVFGERAGNALSEALGHRIRSPVPMPLHNMQPSRHRVMLLGGQLLYGGGLPEQHLELLLQGRLEAEFGKGDADAVSLPTVDGWSLQQWLLFDTFYRGYAPQVLVFGVPDDEAAVVTTDGAVREVRRQLGEAPQQSLRDPAVAQRFLHGAGELVGVGGWFHHFWPIPVREPRSNPERLRKTLAAVRAYAAESHCQLVLLAGARLPEELLAVVREAAADAVPLVQLTGDAERDLDRLAAAVLPPLR